jgi:phosphatidylglycerophosphate synthase
MLDGVMRPLIEKPLTQLARGISSLGLSANSITLLGLVIGLACAVSIAVGLDAMALAFLGLNRLADGLDGPIARISGATDRGGYLDIVLDFVFYGAVPLAFVLRDPDANAIAGSVLLFAFYVNGASFLAFAALAAKRGLESTRAGSKSIYFSAGLVEGTETIIFFVLMLLFPAWFPALAFIFAGVTLLTAFGRIILAWTTFAEDIAQMP